MSEDIILYEVKDHIATITLNRPERRNALTFKSFDLLREILKKIDKDPEVRVAIITGSDCGTFCAGMDLKDAAKLKQETGKDLLEVIGDPSFGEIRDLRKPLIAAMNGHAPAGGMMLSLNCDIRVCIEGTTLGITEVKRGRGSPWAMPLFWQMPSNMLLELTLVGDMMPVERFYDIGYINYLEPTVEKVMERANDIAARIASAAPLSVQAAKASAWGSMDIVTRHALALANRFHDQAYASEDAIEGPLAFAEKRDPVWKGR